MKLLHFHRKPISIFVMFTFTILLCFWANQAPASPTAAKNSEATMEQGDSSSPNFIEREREDESSVNKSHKFPWLLVGAVVVLGAVAVYFLVIKKPNYTLTVNVGAGATGTPAANGTYKKGTAVNYNYAPQAGYGSLVVKLDGVAVAAAGSVNMDKDHTLDVSAAIITHTLTVHLGTGTTGTPAATATYNEGQVVNYSYSTLAGYDSLQVKLDGVTVAANGVVAMDKDHTLDVSAGIKKHTLTVHLGTGTTGTPAATATYNEGQVINYNYSALAGYTSLQVKLDGVIVGNNGALAMDKDHTLDVTAVLEKYTLTVHLGTGATGTPAATTIYNKGQVVNWGYSLQAGYSNLLVKLDGITVGAGGNVTMNSNHTLDITASKSFVLSVSKGEHVTGTPASGSYTYASGTNVSYSYAPAAGYSNLEVKIDGVAAPNAGAIAMDANHTLTANLYGANIEVNSTPAGARIFLENVDTGFNTPHTFNYNTAVVNILVLVRGSCGYQEYRQTVSAAIGQTVTVNPTLAVGIREDFGATASSCWGPYYPTNWSVIGGTYKYSGSAPKWSTNVYYKYWSGDYTVTSEMNRKTGSTGSNAIFLATGTSSTSNSGYTFIYAPFGQYCIARYNSINFITGAEAVTWIKNWTVSAAIHSGLNNWNVLKVVKAGGNYTFYINNVLIHSFTDNTYDPHYLMLPAYIGGTTTQQVYDYVYLTPGGSPYSVPGQPVQNVPATDKENTTGIFQTGEK